MEELVEKLIERDSDSSAALILVPSEQVGVLRGGGIFIHDNRQNITDPPCDLIGEHALLGVAGLDPKRIRLCLRNSGSDDGHAGQGEEHGCQFHLRFQNFTCTVFDPTT